MTTMKPALPRSAAKTLLVSLALGGLFVTGCPSDDQPAQPTGPKADTACPKELGPKCKVLKDETDRLSVEYHALVASDTKHDEADKHLKALYRHLMTRRDATPNTISGFLYTSEAQFNTPPLSPVASVIQKPGDKAPTFEIKIAPELWQQVEEALHFQERGDQKNAKRQRKLTYSADPATGKVILTLPFTADDGDDWAKDLSLAQVMNHFTDFALALFSNIPDLKQLAYVGMWKDQQVANIEITKADYARLNLRDVEDRIGRLAGRTMAELAEGKLSDAAAEKAQQRRKSAEYKKVLDQLKGQAMISKDLLAK